MYSKYADVATSPAYACTGVPTWERRALPLAYPVVTRVIDRFLDITPTTAAQSEAQVRMVFDAVATRLSDGRPYLCGDRFTAADLTFAALAASVLMPPEYGVPLPQPGELPVAMAGVVRELAPTQRVLTPWRCTVTNGADARVAARRVQSAAMATSRQEAFDSATERSRAQIRKKRLSSSARGRPAAARRSAPTLPASPSGSMIRPGSTSRRP
jgi:hypothetical protein